MSYAVIIILFIAGIIYILRITTNQKIRTTLITGSILICLFMITCVATTPENPRVHVSGYTRKDGTKVSAYTRRYPGREDEISPYKWFLIFSGIAVIVGTFSLAIRFDQKSYEKENQKAAHPNIDTTRSDSDDESALKTKDNSNTHNSIATFPDYSFIRIGFFDDILKFSRKISVRAYTERNVSSVVDIQAFNQVKAIFSEYEKSYSSYITIHSKYPTKNFDLCGWRQQNHTIYESHAFS